MTEQKSHEYTIKVTQKSGGKVGMEGRVAILSEPTNTKFATITVQSPAEFKGPADSKGRSLTWTPEDIFTSSVAVCFFTTFISIAEKSQLTFKGIEIVAVGILDKNSDGISMMTEIKENISLKLVNEADRERAMKILEKTEQNCLIANSIKTIITPEYQILI